MCNKTNLPNRIEKAKAAIHFAAVTQYDRDGKIRSVILPGTNGKQYQVIVRRANGFSTELLLLVNGNQVKPSYAAQITYHQMAVVMLAAKENGYKISWCANENDAHRLEKLGGKAFRICNFDNPHSVMWGVMKEER